MTLLVGSATGDEPAAGEVRLRTTLLSRARAERRGECRAAPAPAGGARSAARCRRGLPGGGERRCSSGLARPRPLRAARRPSRQDRRPSARLVPEAACPSLRGGRGGEAAGADGSCCASRVPRLTVRRRPEPRRFSLSLLADASRHAERSRAVDPAPFGRARGANSHVAALVPITDDGLSCSHGEWRRLTTSAHVPLV